MARSKSSGGVYSIEERLTTKEAYQLKVRLAELGAKNQIVSVTFDGGWLVHADYGTGRNLVRIVIAGGPPLGPITAQIIGYSDAAVARFVARLWPQDLTVEDLIKPRRHNDDSWFNIN